MDSDRLPSMIVELFGGDEIKSDTKKRTNGDKCSNLAKLLMKHNLLKDVPNVWRADGSAFPAATGMSPPRLVWRPLPYASQSATQFVDCHRYLKERDRGGR